MLKDKLRRLLDDALGRLDNASRRGLSPFMTILAWEDDEELRVQLAVNRYSPGEYVLNIPELTGSTYEYVKGVLHNMGCSIIEERAPTSRELGYVTVDVSRGEAYNIINHILEELGFTESCKFKIEEFNE